MTTFVPSKNSAIAVTNALLTTSPPHVSHDEALCVMRSHFGGAQEIKALSGERDRNFMVRSDAGRCLTLKFINHAESTEEIAMQVAVLKHFAEHHFEREVPVHIPSSLTSQDWLDIELSDGAVRVRAYSYLDGSPGSQLKAEPEVWRDIGRATAQLTCAMQPFTHVGAHRPFLWDVTQLPLLKPMLSVIEQPALHDAVQRFMQQFEQQIQPFLQTLPQQVIHNDLSPSNMLSCAEGRRVVGVLDFGDMVYAPRIAELAVAASYQMSRGENPLAVLDAVMAGYGEVLELTEQERTAVIDLVMARLVQRIVITSWRAAQFPANSTYILRSRSEAEALFKQLMTFWEPSRTGAEQQ
ncbi:phosphotransferase [Paenalcaligenes sp. Me131]|uniref:phosphotransferase n=1 Tax=Paenalcaligenes sp. Me131 TaxID=3392636 RepID=UPI003D28EFA9